MTTAPVRLQPVQRVLTGTRDEIRRDLMELHRAGRLVSITPPQPVQGGGWRTRIVVLAPLPAAMRRGVRARVAAHRRVAVAVAGVGLAVVAAAIWLVVSLVVWIVAHWPLVLAGTILVLVLAGGGASRCRGLHCGGCRR